MNPSSTRVSKVWDALDTLVWTALGVALIWYGDGQSSLPAMLFQMDDRIER